MTTWIGRPSAALSVLSALSGVDDPGATPPSFTGAPAAIHFSTLVIPLALVSAQTVCSVAAAPTYSNFRASNSMPFWPRT